jgi:hypothetical protein
MFLHLDREKKRGGKLPGTAPDVGRLAGRGSSARGKVLLIARRKSRFRAHVFAVLGRREAR